MHLHFGITKRIVKNEGNHDAQQSQINPFGEPFNERKYGFKENDYVKLRKERNK